MSVEKYDGAEFDIVRSIRDPSDSADAYRFKNGEWEPIWSVIEGFERDDPLADYTGDIGSFNIQSTTVYEGDNALESTSSSFRRIIKTSGFGIEIATGTRFDWHTKPNASNTRLRFGVESLDSHYAHLIADSQHAIIKRDGGTFTELASESITRPSNEFIRGVIEWDTDDTIKTTVFDASGNQIGSTLSATDSTFTNETGIGFATFENPAESIDHVRVIGQL